MRLSENLQLGNAESREERNSPRTCGFLLVHLSYREHLTREGVWNSRNLQEADFIHEQALLFLTQRSRDCLFFWNWVRKHLPNHGVVPLFLHNLCVYALLPWPSTTVLNQQQLSSQSSCVLLDCWSTFVLGLRLGQIHHGWVLSLLQFTWKKKAHLGQRLALFLLF